MVSVSIPLSLSGCRPPSPCPPRWLPPAIAVTAPLGRGETVSVTAACWRPNSSLPRWHHSVGHGGFGEFGSGVGVEFFRVHVPGVTCVPCHPCMTTLFCAWCVVESCHACFPVSSGLCVMCVCLCVRACLCVWWSAGQTVSSTDRRITNRHLIMFGGFQPAQSEDARFKSKRATDPAHKPSKARIGCHDEGS